VLASLSAAANNYMRALTLVNLLKPALAMSRCCLLPFFFFYFNQIYKNFIIEALPLQSAVGRDGQKRLSAFFGGKTPV
jgi:hypothetical protein